MQLFALSALQLTEKAKQKDHNVSAILTMLGYLQQLEADVIAISLNHI